MTAPYIDNADPLVGFVPRGLPGWIDLLTSQYQGIFPGVDFSSSTPDGQWVATLAGNYALMEDLLQQIYNSRSPAGAVGAGLSRLVRLNGLTRKPATSSTAPVTLSGVAGTVIPLGSLVGSASDTNKPAFATTTALTIGAGGTIGGTVQCTSSGPVPAAMGDLTKILTQVTGWTSVTNTADATPGQAVEADPLLRERRATSVAIPSQSLVDGLEAGLRNMPGVADARVYENPSGVPDADGLPAHSINVIVNPSGATDLDIANMIRLKVGMGVTMVGGNSLDVADSSGSFRSIKWDVAVDAAVYVAIKLTPPPAGLTSDQLVSLQTAFGQAIARYFASDGDLPCRIGNRIPWADLATPINALGLTGRRGQASVAAVYLGTAPNPTAQADLIVPYYSIATFDPSRVAVVT